MGIGQVGVGMASAKVLLWRAVPEHSAHCLEFEMIVAPAPLSDRWRMLHDANNSIFVQHVHASVTIPMPSAAGRAGMLYAGMYA